MEIKSKIHRFLICCTIVVSMVYFLLQVIDYQCFIFIIANLLRLEDIVSLISSKIAFFA